MTRMAGVRFVGTGRSNGASRQQRPRSVASSPTPDRSSSVTSSNTVAACTTQRSPRTVTRSPAAKVTRALWQRAYRGKVTGCVGRSAQLRFQNGNSCAQMRRRIVKKFQHLWVPFQHLLYDAALHAYPAAMDDPHLMQTGGVSFGQVLFDNRRNIARRERMK